MKLFTTRKHNIEEWPKMYNLQNGIYKLSGGYTTVSMVGPQRFAPRPSLVANRNLCYYRSLDICVDIYVTIVRGIFVGKLRLALSRNCTRVQAYQL